MSTTTKGTPVDKEMEEKAQQVPVSDAETGAPEMVKPSESQLISFGDRITYTFAYGKEVGSIHFDRGRGEIFFKGHNVRNMDLEEWQMQMMEQLRQVLNSDEKNASFAHPYARTLDKFILEKEKK